MTDATAAGPIEEPAAATDHASASSFKPSLLTVAGLASIGAGAIHATAAGMHSEHRQAVVAFVFVAVFQIGWGAVTLVRSGAVLGLLGAAGNTAAFGGWLLAKSSGISFVDGLEESESVQLADSLAAGLAVVAVLLALAAVLRLVEIDLTGRIGPRIVGVAALTTAVLAFPGMVSAGSHNHADGHSVSESDDGHAHTDGETGADGESAAAGEHQHDAADEAVPFDPALPIDLSGTEGVTPEQQAEAENLLAINLVRLPQWADPAVAEAAGYHSIGDALTGDEHLINWDLLNDDKILDPDYPESLVYSVDRAGNRTLEAAMYILPQGTTLDSAPDVGGELIQWHIHDNLCFSTDPVAPRVAGLTDSDGECRPPLVKFQPVPMIHVWITPNRCGPFAALEGVGAGQVQEGEERACDHEHGS